MGDDIAYDNHDIDDGLRAGLLDLDELIEVPIIKGHWADIERRHPGLSIDKKLRALVRDQIGTMVGDLIGETRRRIEESGVESVEEVRSAGRQLAGFSEELAEKERVLKRFLYDRLYNASALVPVRVEAQRVVAGLFAAYRDDPSQLPEGWRRDEDAVQRLRTIGDFIAGMTDRFAVARHEELVGPVDLPDRF